MWRILCQRYNYHGDSFGLENVYQYIEQYDGAQKISTLGCYPLRFHSDEKEFRTETLETAKRFVSMIGSCYRQYIGIAYIRTKDSLGNPHTIKTMVDGRVMIDQLTFRRINSNYDLGYTRSVDATIELVDDLATAKKARSKARKKAKSDTKTSDSVTATVQQRRVRHVWAVFKKDGKHVGTQLDVNKYGQAQRPDASHKDIFEAGAESTKAYFTDEELLIIEPVSVPSPETTHSGAFERWFGNVLERPEQID